MSRPRRKLTPTQEIQSELRQTGCPLCGYVLRGTGKKLVEHPNLGWIHENCAEGISFRNVKATSGEVDPVDE